MRTVAATAQYLGKLLAQPCGCGRRQCTVGEHAYHSTRDALPGIRAQAFDDPRVSGTTAAGDIAAGHSFDDKHDELSAMAASINLNCIALANMVAAVQHDRQHPKTTGADEEWCRHHLDTIGSCEPRYRGDLCRRCYDFNRSTGVMPTKQILNAWHRGDRVTNHMVAHAKSAQKKRRRKKKAKK